MSKIQLTNEEKIIRNYLKKLVYKKRIGGISQREVLKFCNEYTKETLKNTRFEKEALRIIEEKNKGTAGSMRTATNGEVSFLSINFESLLGKNGFKSNNENSRFNAFTELLDTLNHETQHYFQSKEVENFRITAHGMTLSNCLEIVREHVATRTERDKFYSLEEGNYEDLYIEGDARRTGAVKTATQLFRILPKMGEKKRRLLIKKVEESIEKDNVEFKEFRYGSKFEKYDRGDVASAYVDEFIAARPKALEEKKYETLGFEYDKDGSRLAFDEVLKNRDEVIDAISSNQKVKRETKQEMIRQANSAFSQIMYNSLRRCTSENIVDIRRRIGDDKFIKEIDYIHNGRMNEIEEKAQKYKQYEEFYKNNKSRIKSQEIKDAYNKLNDIYAKTGYVVKRDSQTGEEYDTINSKQVELLVKLGRKVIDSKNQYPLYTPEELEESNEKRKIAKAEYKENMKRAFEQRKFEQYKKREAEKEKEIARKKAEHQRKMKNPLYRLRYNIINMLQNSNKKKLGEPAYTGEYRKEELYEKRDECQKLSLEKEKMENEFSSIKKESEEMLIVAENKLYLKRQEGYELDSNSKEEEEIGKGI